MYLAAQVNKQHPFLIQRHFLYWLMVCTWLVTGCISSDDENNRISWNFRLSDHGTNSTPRYRDLNNDGTLDIILGAGKHEHEDAEYGVIALNGLTGEPLWHVGSHDQIVGSASFTDLTGDGTDDIVIGGRSAQLFALDGRSGEEIWTYRTDNSNSVYSFARYNFFNTQIIRDVDQDGYEDILATNGGNVWAPPNSDMGREAGVLMVLSGASGQVISADTMPDGRETYFSPIIFESPLHPETIVFGSGGETASGGLFMTTLPDLLNNDISEARMLLNEENHGFIAPVLCTDITGDGISDIIGNTHGGKVFAIDGRKMEVIWTSLVPDTESSTMPAVGHFRKGKGKDVFAFMSIGTFPRNRGTVGVLIDGINGNILRSDTLGCFGFSSPILVQTDKDSTLEILLSTNSYNNCSILFANNMTSLQIFDYSPEFNIQTLGTYKGKNLSITPGIIDLDMDGRYELIHSVLDNFSTIYLMYGMNLTVSPLPKTFIATSWNTYMGEHYDGIYPD